MRRLLANPKALRLGRVVITPLALLGSVQPQPYPARGAPEARATKLGVVLFGGVARARTTASAESGSGSPQGAPQ